MLAVNFAPNLMDVGIPDTSYEPPAGAYYVSPTGSGVSTNPNAPGSARATMTSSGVPAGSSIVFRGGEYRGIGGTNHANGLGLNKRLTLQAYPGEQPWIKGSEVVTSWTKTTPTINGVARDVWSTPWAYKFNHSSYVNDPGQFIDPAHPEAGDEDMAFIDDASLRQVQDNPTTAAREGSTWFGPGTFWIGTVDGQQRAYIGDSPADRKVELTAYGRGLSTWNGNSPSTVIRGLGFAHFAHNAVVAASPGMVLENNTFAWNGNAGLNVSGTPSSGRGDDVTVRGNRFVGNGMVGANGGGADRLRFEGNSVAYNNVEAFRAAWAAAGAKFFGADGQRFFGNDFNSNYAAALWLDISQIDAAVIGNTVRNTKGIGIHVELSHDTVVAFNVVYDNGVGIFIHDSSGTRVWNNTLVGNNTHIRMNDGSRVNDPYLNLDPQNEGAGGKSLLKYDRGATWVTRETTIKNNILSDPRDYHVNAEGIDIQNRGPVTYGPNTDDDGKPGGPTTGKTITVQNPHADTSSQFLADGASMDNNAYHRTSATAPTNAIRWDTIRANRSVKNYATLSAWRNADENGDGIRENARFEANALVLDNVADPFFLDRAGRDYRLRPDSPAVGRGEAIPQDIADLAGVPTNIGYLGALGSTDRPPALAPIADRSIPASQDTLSVPLPATDPDGDPLSYTARAESLAYVLDQQLSLSSDGNLYENYGGRGERWMQGSGGVWYFIVPTGELYLWDGGGGGPT